MVVSLICTERSMDPRARGSERMYVHDRGIVCHPTAEAEPVYLYISYFMYRVPTKILLCVQLYAFLVSTFIVPVAAIPIVVHIPPIVVNARFLANFSKLFEQLGVFGMLHTVILASVSGVGTFLNLFGVRLG
jgi:hypothetical protein